jgi:hypothetical protein
MGWENALKLPLTLLVRDGHSCQSPLALMLILILTLILTQTGKGTASAVPIPPCHPEEAESHAKRATPDEGPVNSARSGRARALLAP